MKPDYLHDMTGGGKFKHVVAENLVRLYQFGEEETHQLVTDICKTVIIAKSSLALHDLPYIDPVNCRLTLIPGDSDIGILRTGNDNLFECHLTLASYGSMIGMMLAIGNGFNWLAEVSADNIDFLYSPGGTW